MPKTNVEYATDNITVYRYCKYNCMYCWAWRLPLYSSRISRGKYRGVDEALKYARIRGKRAIVISFTSDPYPPEEENLGLTRKVLEILSNTNHKVMVLTKNPKTPATRDIDLFINSSADMWLGTTVISLEKTWFEPKAPPPSERLKYIKEAHEKGVKTWLSIEPIIPETTFPEEIVEQTLNYVDFYVLGAFNYAKQLGFKYTKEQLKKWYLNHVKEAVKILNKNKKQYHIKIELLKYLLP